MEPRSCGVNEQRSSRTFGCELRPRSSYFKMGVGPNKALETTPVSLAPPSPAVAAARFSFNVRAKNREARKYP